MIKKGKIKIPRNRENISDTDLNKMTNQVTAESGVRGGDDERQMCKILEGTNDTIHRQAHIDCGWLQGVNRSNTCVHYEDKMAKMGVENKDNKRKILFFICIVCEERMRNRKNL